MMGDAISDKSCPKYDPAFPLGLPRLTSGEADYGGFEDTIPDTLNWSGVVGDSGDPFLTSRWTADG